MEIVNRYTDMAGKYRVIVVHNDTSIPLKFQSEVSDSVVFDTAQTVYDRIVDEMEVRSWTMVSMDAIDNKDILKDAIIKIKNNPALTLTQYNNYLSTKPWYEAAIIRYFVYKLALGLAQYHGVELSQFTESFILGKVRNWIVATPLRKIAKIVLNNVNEDI